MKKLLNISELSKELNFTSLETKKPLNYILRYWEKQFTQIKPKKINNRRYYSSEQVYIIRMIKFLLKDKGMTISGVKNLLNSKTINLDEDVSIGLKKQYYKNSVKHKINNILKKINKVKNYGKKISS